MNQIIPFSPAPALTGLRPMRRRIVHQPPNVEIDGEVPYRHSWAAAVPPEPGIYLIRDLRGLLYIGRTKDLRDRFFQHLDHSHNELLRLAIARPWGDQRFAWIRHQAPAALEEQLISHLLPICNERHCRRTLNP